MRLFALLVLSGCATIARYDGAIPPPDEAIVRAYHAVRSEGAQSAVAGGMVFCATRGGLEAVLEQARTSDEAAKLDDGIAEDHVRSVLKSDPVLHDEAIQAKLVKGEAFLYGKLRSEQHAAWAVYDALQVAGVGVVRAEFVTPESPTPMRARALGPCY